jgi:inosine/xanthosine triphosphatase
METGKSSDRVDSPMRIGVGSGNPVKVAATEGALAGLAGAVVESAPVESGVSEQPHGEDETIAGARNRAHNVLDGGDYDLGVGIEGGVAPLDVDEGPDALLLVMWAVVTDGSTVGYGSGPRLVLPESVADRIRAGEELGPVMDDVLGTEGVARNEGAAGVLTGNAITRKGALKTAVAGALGPFVTDRY